MRLAISLLVNEVKEWEEEDPDQIDNVPVQAYEIDRCKVVGSKVTPIGSHQKPEEKSNTYQHVDTMQTGQAEVDAEECANIRRLDWLLAVLGVFFQMLDSFLAGLIHLAPEDAFMNLVAVLNILDAHEAEAAQDGNPEIDDQPATVAQLGTANAPRHRQAAEEQHAGIDGTHVLVKEAVGVLEDFGVVVTIDGVSGKESTEEEDLLCDERPHAQLASFELLFQRIEVVCQVLGVIMRMIAVVISCVSVCHGHLL